MRKSKKSSKKSKKSTKNKKLISNHNEVYKITSRIYKELRENQPICFKKLRGFCGHYDYVDDESLDDKITLDHRRDILPTLIHEFLHKWHINACETWVLKKERAIMKHITPPQAKRLLKALLDVI